MLVVSRKPEEAVLIDAPGGAIVVRVVEIEYGKVRLGFSAARTTPIFREEIASPELVKAARAVEGAIVDVRDYRG